MTERHVDPVAVLGELKDFQRRTARWVFQRMFDDNDPAVRFLVADEVGLGKTHVAKGVIAQVIDHLETAGDQRHDIVYVCSNGAIARQNLRKLAPAGVEPLESVERLTMLPLAALRHGEGGRSGLNLLAITPGTSLKFGQNTGRFEERALAYTFLRAVWGADVMNARARWIFWLGVSQEWGDQNLRERERAYRPRIQGSLDQFQQVLAETDAERDERGLPSLRAVFDELVAGLAWKREFPDDLWRIRRDFIGEVRRILAIVGIAALQPDLVVLDEFQRFKELLDPDPTNFASEMASKLFSHRDPETGRPTRTLLLSATPYRMYTTATDVEGDHYADFLATCGFLFQDEATVERLRDRLDALRRLLTGTITPEAAERICAEISTLLRRVMVRTERLASTPDRDGMLREVPTEVSVARQDLEAYFRLGLLAECLAHHEPTEYWKSGPYLVNFMERYQLKESIVRCVEADALPDPDALEPGPGLLPWGAVDRYQPVDPQNGRLRWLLADLERHGAFRLLWIPPSLRYYDTGSCYETPEARSFTKRLIFSGWALVPKVVSSLVTYEAERNAFATREHRYSADYRRRGGQRLAFRVTERGAAEGDRRAAGMTALLAVWPSPTLARFGDPRPTGFRPQVEDLLARVERRIADALQPLVDGAPKQGTVDQRWYWAAPLLLDQAHHRALVQRLLADPTRWEGAETSDGFRAHLATAQSLTSGVGELGRVPDDLSRRLSEVAVGGPGPCALRAVSAVTGLGVAHDEVVDAAAWIASAFRAFYNAPEVTALVASSTDDESEDATSGYWQDIMRHGVDGSLQALLDEHTHVLRDWLGFVDLNADGRRTLAARAIAESLADALEVRTSGFTVDIPRRKRDGQTVLDAKRMRSRFAASFGNQSLEDGGEARVESVSTAFNSPFWPFVLTSTSVGQEGLDFHLWSHAVVHWNLPSNPVDLEQREGRVHRYKGHAVRRNVAARFGDELFSNGMPEGGDPWDELFRHAATTRANDDTEMIPYWVFADGPARIERHAPVLPFSREAAALPRLRKTLATYRLAFGQPRQDELVEFLGESRSEEELQSLVSRLRIDLSPPTDEEEAALFGRLRDLV